MKIIISRKGFDSSYGGVPSPILEGHGPLSLPIPVDGQGRPASAYRIAGMRLGQALSDLTEQRHSADTEVHLDPDLDRKSCKRKRGWRPAFGQDSTAQFHLRNQDVGVGDLFLFFGWFRHARIDGERWAFRGPEAGVHALFGWLQVGEVLEIDSRERDSMPNWLHDHPHVLHADKLRGMSNSLYIGAKHLALPGVKASAKSVQGAGRFTRWTDALRLSVPDGPKSLWAVPTWLEPGEDRPPLTYHGNSTRWRREGAQLQLQSVYKGQEFVLDCDHYPEAPTWAHDLIKTHAR